MNSSATIRKALPANPVNANTTSAQVFPLISNTAAPATVAVPGKLVVEARKFRVRASGNLFTGGTLTALATLLMAKTIPGTPLTAGNWTVLGAGTARSVANTWSPWYIESDLIFESNGGTMQGTFSQLINNLWDAPAAISNRLTGLNGTNAIVGTTAIAEPVFYLAVALTFGTGNAANLGNLSEFVLEA